MSDEIQSQNDELIESQEDGLEEESSNVSAQGGESGSDNIQDSLSDIVDEIEGKENSKEKKELSNSEKSALKKKLQLKVYGKEIEDELDWNDEDGIKKRLQKAHAFDQVSQQFSQLKGEIQKFVEDLRSNPTSVLSDLGLNFDELAENHIRQIVDESKKSPEQLAQEKMEKELKELKAEKEKILKEKQESELERLRNEHASMIEADITDALEKTETVLPKKNPWVLRKVAETMLVAMKNGYPNVKASEVIPFVENQFKKDLQSMFDVFPEELIENIVGKNNMDRVRKRRLPKQSKKVNTKTARQLTEEISSKPKDNDNKDDNTKSYKDFFDFRS